MNQNHKQLVQIESGPVLKLCAMLEMILNTMLQDASAGELTLRHGELTAALGVLFEHHLRVACHSDPDEFRAWVRGLDAHVERVSQSLMPVSHA